MINGGQTIRFRHFKMATQEEYDDIIRYKTATEKKYRDGLSDNQKRNIRDKATRYVEEQLSLYVVEKDDDLGTQKRRKVIVKKEEKDRILRMCHSGVDGMHFGRDKTYKKVYLCFVTVRTTRNVCINIFIFNN